LSHRSISIIRDKLLAVLALLVICLLASCTAATGNPQKVISGSHGEPQATRTVAIQPTRTAQPTQPTQPTQPAGVFSRPVTYVALGASDAVGVGSDSPGSQGYVPLIADHLSKGSHLLNLGVSGIRLHEALSEELPLAISSSPDLVTIWLVVNDFVGGVSYQDYLQDLDTLLSQLHTRTHARIVMADIPDLTRLPAFANQTSAQRAQMLAAIKQWNKGIAQKATQYGVTLLDLFSHGAELTSHPEYISGDGFHPSAAGYVQLADLFLQAIQQH
jgi:lysophospholipase L1-like esterase